jgi:hypothetical protein
MPRVRVFHARCDQ